MQNKPCLGKLLFVRAHAAFEVVAAAGQRLQLDTIGVVTAEAARSHHHLDVVVLNLLKTAGQTHLIFDLQ